MRCLSILLFSSLPFFLLRIHEIDQYSHECQTGDQVRNERKPMKKCHARFGGEKILLLLPFLSYFGTGIFAKYSRTTELTLSSSREYSGFRTILCERASSTTNLTSSGMTKSRPNIIAIALLILIRESSPLGLGPAITLGSFLHCEKSLMYPSTSSLTLTEASSKDLIFSSFSVASTCLALLLGSSVCQEMRLFISSSSCSG